MPLKYIYILILVLLVNYVKKLQRETEKYLPKSVLYFLFLLLITNPVMATIHVY